MREINNLKTRLSAAFKMKDLCPVKQILGMKISRDRSASTLNLSQELYIKKVLSKFIVNDAKPRTTPMENQLKWSKEKPDIAQAVGVVSMYMENPGKEHWEVVKWFFRYLKGTSSTSLCFGKGKVTLQDFVDADLGRDVDSSNSTSGCIYTIGGTTVSMMYMLQKCVIY
uniref:Reverse transcriptase Ty1/copia-type domain-containing protein n=1 Tax=Solanum lycopersicum TaxID=4081 RepID=A0A3Q7GJD5_SOLLC